MKLSVDISRYSEAAKSAGAEPEKPEVPAGGPLPIIPLLVGLAAVGVLAVFLLRRKTANV